MAKRIALVVVLVLIAIQFIRPARNISTQPPTKNDLTVMYPPSDNVRHILATACYDCHSNNTDYPWYANVEPVGWWLASHVNDGKRELNFSEFGTYSPKKQAHKFNAIGDRISDHSMPLASYTLIHRSALLNDQQIHEVTDWVEAAHDKLLPNE